MKNNFFILISISILISSLGCSSKEFKERSYFSKVDQSIDRKRMMKNIDLEIRSIVRLKREFSRNDMSGPDMGSMEERLREEMRDD